MKHKNFSPSFSRFQLFKGLLCFFIIVFASVHLSFAQNTPDGTIVTYAKNGTPTQGIKIKTNIPYNSPAMPTVILEGFQYGNTKNIDLTLSWYIYNGEFIHYKVSSAGSWTPKIKLAKENNKVVIFIDEKGYYTRFTVRAYGKDLPGDADANYAGWTVVDNEALSGTNVVTLPYENRMGSLFFKQNQSLFGDYGAYLQFRSNHSTVTGMIFYDKEKRTYGRVYGNGNGANFGLLDGDGNWSYLAAKDNYTAFRINNSEKMRIKSNGFVGIGTSVPKGQLQVGEQLVFTSPTTSGGWGGIGRNMYWSGDIKRVVNDEAAEMTFNDKGEIIFRTAPLGGGANSTITNLVSNLTIKNGGGVFVHPNPMGREFEVCGTMRAKECIIQNNWCDFVFEENYDLPSLAEEKQFIEENGHLIGFESEKEMDGEIDLGEVTKRQQQKIEETVLHLIQFEEQNEELKAQNENLSSQYDDLLEKYDDLAKLVLQMQSLIENQK